MKGLSLMKNNARENHGSARRRFGFTLIEIMLVVLIIGMLAGVYFMTAGGQDDKAKAELTLTRIKRVMSALELYKRDVSDYPEGENEEALNALVEKPDFDDDDTGKQWGPRPYIDKVQLSDLWKTPLFYKLEEQEVGETTFKKALVWSAGPNKEDDDGAGDDIKGWEEDTQE